MATTNHDSYDSVGIKEDVSARIWDKSPTDTPIASAVAKVGMTQRKHEFQVHRLAAPGLNEKVEGADAGTDDSQASQMLDNVGQISTKQAFVSGSLEAMDAYGRDSEMSWQIANRMLELKTDVEVAICGRSVTTGQAKVVGDSSTARRMGAIQAYLSTCSVSMTDGTAPAGPFPNGTASRVDGTTTAAFDEPNLKSALQLNYDNGGKANLMVCSSVNKGIASTFDGGTTRFNTADDKKLVTSIDVYSGDFHDLEIIPSRIINGRDVIGIEVEYCELAELRPMHDKQLGDVGDSWKRMVIWEGTIAVRNEQAHFIVSDTTG